VRISHDADPRFEGERWALDAVRARGVPTPRVLLVEVAGLGEASVSVCVEEKVPGVALSAVLSTSGAAEETGALLADVGTLLGRVHGVPVAGFGYLRAPATAWDVTFEAVMTDVTIDADPVQRAAARWGVPLTLTHRALALIDEHRSLYDLADARLVHGDIGPDHVLVRDGRITGVIDFQQCSGNHPVIDLAHWSLTQGDRAPLTAVMAGYEDRDAVVTHPALMTLATLREALWMLRVRNEQNRPLDIDLFARALHEGVRFFS
jgi:aminoglycoside phosphotransferase (APT) family kinase protein